MNIILNSDRERGIIFMSFNMQRNSVHTLLMELASIVIPLLLKYGKMQPSLLVAAAIIATLRPPKRQPKMFPISQNFG